MKQELLTNYDAFRLWFNRMFSLSVNGKLCALGRLHDWKRFAYRLYKLLNGYYRRPISNVIVLRISGQSIKLFRR